MPQRVMTFNILRPTVVLFGHMKQVKKREHYPEEKTKVSSSPMCSVLHGAAVNHAPEMLYKKHTDKYWHMEWTSSKLLNNVCSTL